MKKALLTLLIFSSLVGYSQQYNNEWINYSRTYYKFKVGSSALYRISQATLSTLGIGSTPAEQFQLWRNGRQVPLFTSVQTGPLSSTDYIEFWGAMNDGLPDSALYREPSHHLNKKWSLETDTAAFYLTVNPAGGNLRFTPTVNTLPSALPVEPYFVHTAGVYFREKQNRGYAAVVGEYVYSSAYDVGEGFSSQDMIANASRSIPFTDLQPFTGGGAPPASFAITASGNALNPRQIKIKANGTEIGDHTMDFFDDLNVSMPVSQSIINTGTVNIDVTNAAAGAGADRMVIGTAELTYARLFNFGNATNFQFTLAANAAGNYLEISNFNHQGVNPVLYDITNNKRYVCDISGGLVKVALQPSATARQLLLVSEHASAVSAITSFKPRNFVNYGATANQGNYLIVSHPALMNGPGGTNPVNDYKNYRSSSAGGSYNAKIYDVEEIEDQFGFGIKKNPLGLKNFFRWARATFTAPIKDVFLVGKGMNYIQLRTYESQPDIDKLDFVPTFGEPASDNLLTADPGLDEIPRIPIGRLSAITPQEVTTYLNKVIQYEQAQNFSSPLIRDRAWLKNVIHVIGASDPGLGASLTGYMDEYNRVLADTFYGANINTFSKVTAAPVEQANTDRLYHLFEEGVGLMTYFGHSSASSLEFNLDNPDNYNNTGKYPVMIVMGCNAGNFYTYNPLRLSIKETLSEKFVMAEQKGAVAFIASSHFGIVHYLDIYNSRNYYAAGVTHYAKTLGEIAIEAITQVYNLTSQADYYSRFHCEQTILHGDPALRLDGNTPKPDYVIEDQLVKVSPSFISVAETSFKVDAKFMNIGKALSDSIVIEVRRTFPDLTTQVVRRDTIPGIRYIDSLSYTFDIVPTRDKGLNKISFCLDADNKVSELYETNNCLTRDVVIYEDEARPVYPFTFAIVNSQNQKLIASTANPFSGLKQYTMELDTTEFFNSPLKVTRTLSSSGGMMEFTPGVTFRDSTVYYWRVAPVPASGQPVWNKSSFVYLNPATSGLTDVGYNQSQFFQHTKSVTDRMKYDSTMRKWNYNAVSQNLFIQMGTWITSGCTTPTCISVSINSVPHIRLVCWFSSITFNVFDPVSFRPWENHTVVANTYPSALGTGLYGSTDNYCFDEPRYYNFEYRYDSLSNRNRAMNFMDNVIPDGFYVVVRNATLINAYGFPQAWAATWKNDELANGPGISLYHRLKAAGFAGIDSFYKARPWVLVYKKNDPTFTPQWLVGKDSIDNPTLSVNLNTTDTVGYLTSPVFGPAKAWKQLIWRGNGDPTGDTATVDIIGIKNDGSEEIVIPDINTTQQNLDISGSVDASIYPNLKLRLRTADNTHYTPYQLNYWRLTYDPVPEGALAPNLYMRVRDTVELGEPAEFKLAFKNITNVPFDSMKVKMIVTDRNNLPHIVPLPKWRKLLTTAPNDTIQIGAMINTSTLPGMNTVYLEANPNNDQLEQYHFNNFAYRNLFVKPDSLNPFMDVTFDGVHILNKDLVSSRPDIMIRMKDEARWMVLDDTSLFTLQIRYPDNSLHRYYFNNDTVQFVPAGQAPNNDNTASINVKPFFKQDGEYELIVKGKDKSTNASGSRNDIEYRVLFNVINKAMISNMLNYPNPFTTSTAFVFTITGNEVPQNIKIEIMTITGKIVREITTQELGPLHIGRNITEFKWDGTDQYGQKLANGVYLYRVVTNLNGKSLEKYKSADDNTDKYFNKGYGKMYLMR